MFSVHGIGWAARGLRWVFRSPQADLLKAGLGNLRIPLLPHHSKAVHVPWRQQTLIVSSGRKPNFWRTFWKISHCRLYMTLKALVAGRGHDSPGALTEEI